MAQLPLSLACSSGGSAYLMVLNFATGAAFPLPELDVPGDGKLDLSDVPSCVSSGTVDSVLDRGRAKQRISWWEVRQ